MTTANRFDAWALGHATARDFAAHVEGNPYAGPNVAAELAGRLRTGDYTYAEALDVLTQFGEGVADGVGEFADFANPHAGWGVATHAVAVVAVWLLTDPAEPEERERRDLA